MMKTHKKTLWTIVIITLLVVVAVLKLVQMRRTEAKMPLPKDFPIVVSAITPQLSHPVLTLPYLALTKNDKDVMLSSRISGRVNYIRPSGSKVYKGDIIARIDNTSIISGISSVKSELAATRGSLSNLEATHQRTLELLKVKGASIEQSQAEENKIAELEAKVESLNQKLNELKNQLTYATITSPVDGIVSKTMVNNGDMAMPGHPVAALSAKNGFYLLVRIPDNLSINGVIFKNKKYDAIPLNSTFNGLKEYKVYLNDENMTSGNRVTVDVIVFDGEGIKLPFDAVINREGKSYVLVVNGNKAIPEEVSVISSGEEGLVISNGNVAGKHLVTGKPDILLKIIGGVSIKIKES
jgi:RND family efflux transporter MFP subunit